MSKNRTKILQICKNNHGWCLHQFRIGYQPLKIWSHILCYIWSKLLPCKYCCSENCRYNHYSCVSTSDHIIHIFAIIILGLKQNYIPNSCIPVLIINVLRACLLAKWIFIQKCIFCLFDQISFFLAKILRNRDIVT